MWRDHMEVGEEECCHMEVGEEECSQGSEVQPPHHLTHTHTHSHAELSWQPCTVSVGKQSDVQ